MKRRRFLKKNEGPTKLTCTVLYMYVNLRVENLNPHLPPSFLSGILSFEPLSLCRFPEVPIYRRSLCSDFKSSSADKLFRMSFASSRILVALYLLVNSLLWLAQPAAAIVCGIRLEDTIGHDGFFSPSPSYLSLLPLFSSYASFNDQICISS